MQQWYICPYCKQNILYGTTPCQYCGHIIQWSAQPVVNSKKPASVVGWIVAAVLLLVIVSCSICIGSKATPVSIPDNPAVSTPPVQTNTIPSVTVKKWQGTGSKTTEPFEINTSPWAIHWSNSPTSSMGGHLAIIVYSASSNEYLDLAANTTKTGSDNSYVYHKGIFYLDISGVNTDWTVEVLK
ncbi:hypothetical protein M0R72_11540 [Candidatus Pacearchaeota archaeon]|jgi:hypothetical protein|nr:hypothetical protein [Candidatus Pacearchaeota archaeon]